MLSGPNYNVAFYCPIISPFTNINNDYWAGFGIAFGDGSAIGGFAGLSDFFLVRENKSDTDIHTSSAG